MDIFALGYFFLFFAAVGGGGGDTGYCQTLQWEMIDDRTVELVAAAYSRAAAWLPQLQV